MEGLLAEEELAREAVKGTDSASTQRGNVFDGGGAVGAFDVVGPEGAVQVDPGLDAEHLVRGKRHVVVAGVEGLPEFALEGAEGERGEFLAAAGVPAAVEIVD